MRAFLPNLRDLRDLRGRVRDYRVWRGTRRRILGVDRAQRAPAPSQRHKVAGPRVLAVVDVADVPQKLIARTLRVPAAGGPPGDGAAAARQLDVALMAVGFKCSRELLDHLSGVSPAAVHAAGATTLRAVRELVGDHVHHNPYFIDFPANVPDTEEFWARCVAAALREPASTRRILGQLARGRVNLLDLPTYGRPQHSYEEMLAAHDRLIPAAKDRLRVLALGDALERETHALYLSLAGSPVPLVESDLGLLGALAELHAHAVQPELPVRENRAVVNRARLLHGMPLTIDTPVDVLRLACALSAGDVTLETPTRLRSLRRADRRALLAALDAVVVADPAKLADVARHAEPFKRLGERLHPHEHARWPSAQDVFAVARGERTVRSLAGRVEVELAAGRPDKAIAVLERAPGMLVRAVDRLARAGADPEVLADAVRRAAPATATRVLLGLREHLLNRDAPASARMFVNRRGRAWVASDARAPLAPATVQALAAVLDEAIAGRLPRPERLVVDPAARTLAVPLSDKGRPGGLAVLPRGSVQPLGDRVRFFVYWKEQARRTDYDLSVLLLDAGFDAAGQVSWTNLRGRGMVHSGDVVSSPSGASEFIDVDLSTVAARYVVPQVNVYAGEGFDQVDETFFGFMERDPSQRGRPFEPRTVRAKSALFGAGRVSLPVLFFRGDDGGWHAKWMHLNLSGHPYFNRVEGNAGTTSLLVKAVVERRYLTVAYLERLMRDGGAGKIESDGSGPVTYLGLERPENLPPGSTVITPGDLPELLNSA